MIGLWGRIALLVGLGAATAGAVVALGPGGRSSPRAERLTRGFAYAWALALILAVVLMEVALLLPDFSVSYVAQVGSRSVPVHQAVASLWSALEGSLLFWAFVLAVQTAVFAWMERRRASTRIRIALGISLVVGVFFTLLVAGTSNPFAPSVPVPQDGPGPNALLQNHLLMVIHPPALYIGYVGMTLPFSMAVAALWTGRLDAAWMATLRRWALWVWSFLTLGILLGGWWSYEVLGWGGYWSWDPVENASLMPWLTATAFVHSALVTERRGALRGWTLVLALSSFLLTLVGTFMTRSGVFNSVHAFTQSSIGPVFLGFITVVFAGSVVLLSLRLDRLEGLDTQGIPGLGREASFYVNNLLFVVFTLTVLLGTLFPLFSEGVTGEKISVGAPYFDRMAMPLGLGILLLMGIGPALTWGAGPMGAVLRRLALPLGAGALAAGACFAAGIRHGGALAGYGAATFAAAVSVRELVRPLALAVRRGRSPWSTARRLRRRYAAHGVHLGVVLAAVAITASTVHRVEGDLTFEPGETKTWQGYRFTYLGTDRVEEDHRLREVSRFEVRREDRDLGRMEPSLNHYRNASQPIGTPAVASGPLRDLYLSVLRLERGENRVTLRVLVEPMVVWLWVGGLVMMAFGLLAAWPRRVSNRGRSP